MVPELGAFSDRLDNGFPYDGAKEHYSYDIRQNGGMIEKQRIHALFILPHAVRTRPTRSVHPQTRAGVCMPTGIRQ
jgi:hypothetical protein